LYSLQNIIFIIIQKNRYKKEDLKNIKYLKKQFINANDAHVTIELITLFPQKNLDTLMNYIYKIIKYNISMPIELQLWNFSALPYDSSGLARCQGQKGCSYRWMLPATSSESDDQSSTSSLRTSSSWSCYETKGKSTL